jgi:hypothetical protein
MPYTEAIGLNSHHVCHIKCECTKLIIVYIFRDNIKSQQAAMGKKHKKPNIFRDYRQ